MKPTQESNRTVNETAESSESRLPADAGERRERILESLRRAFPPDQFASPGGVPPGDERVALGEVPTHERPGAATSEAPRGAPQDPPPQQQAQEFQTIPARMLNEFAYCPRLFYYEFVE
jgi:hypothetical protein